MGRVSSIGRSTFRAGGWAFGALLATVSTIALSSVVFSAPLERADTATSETTEARVAELLKPASGRSASIVRTAVADKPGPDAPASSFELSSAELINVRVRGQPEFTGEYRINPDMTISIARLGRVPIGSMTAPQLEHHLGERLSAALRQDVNVAVEVVRFRPFFITGQVSAPGSVEWRPGLTLIQAISLSGGIMRTATDADTPERRLLLEQARVRHGFAVAQLARLSAEKEGKDTVEVERLLNGFVAKAMPENRDALETFLTRQNRLLEEQRAAHESRVAGLARERDAVLQELEAARTQSDEVKQQVQLTEAHMEGIESLMAKKLLTNSRYLEHRRALAEIKVRYTETVQLVQRARARYNGLERDIHTVQSERDALLNDRMETLEREVAELEITLGGPQGLMEASSGSLGPALTYHIARKSKDSVETLVANLFTEILPGDVVIVSTRQRSRGAMPEGGPATFARAAPTALDEMQQIMEGAVATGLPMMGSAPITTGGTQRPASYRSVTPPSSRVIRDSFLSSGRTR